MTSAATFLAVSDIRGDLAFLGRVLELAVRKDVGAQAVFINGNLVGKVITDEERTELEAARVILKKELDYRPDLYKDLHIHDIAMLGLYMSKNPENYRRTAENGALRQLRVLLGLKDTNGRFTEVGRAGMRARRVYADANAMIKRSPVPVYVSADTPFVEDVFDQTRWLHFAWFSFAGYSVRGLTPLDIDDSTGIPELAIGVRRGGNRVALDEYSLASGDLIFAHSLNPLLHEALSAVPGKLVVICGDGDVDLMSYTNTILSSQKPQVAYLYKTQGSKCVRRTYPLGPAGWGGPSLDDVALARGTQGRDTATMRRELDEQAKLAGFGADLVKFVDLVRVENPTLAGEIEKSRSRVDAIMTYVRDLEAQKGKLLDVISTQRAGLERVVRGLDAVLGEERTRKIMQVLNIPMHLLTDVATIDAAYLEVAKIIADAVAPHAARQ